MDVGKWLARQRTPKVWQALAEGQRDVETLEDGTEVRLGVWIMNQKTRRTKLTADKLAALAPLGLGWARQG